MYLEIYQYEPGNHEQVEMVQQEMRDFINYHPQFTVIKTESIVLKNIVTIHLWYVEEGEQGT